jgi:hypothetical protein
VRVLDPATTHGAPSIRVMVSVMGGVLIVMGAAFLVLFQSRFAVYVLAGSGAIGMAAMLGGAAAIWFSSRRRFAPALLSVAMALVVANWIFVVRLLPSFEAYKPGPGLAAALQPRAGPDDLIVTYNVALPSLVYYLRRHIEVFYDNGPVLDLIASGRPLYVMMTSYDYEEKIKPAIARPLCQVTAVPTFDVKLRNVLSRQRLPEVLLLTNRCEDRPKLDAGSAK